MTTTSTPAGWYDDPNGQGRRYWDGSQWTEHFSDQTAGSPPHAAASPPPAVGSPPPAPAYGAPAAYGSASPAYAPVQKTGSSGLVIAGYICAILIPIAGLVIGIVALTKRSDPRVGQHGIWIIVASIVAFVLWFALMSAGGGSSY